LVDRQIKAIKEDFEWHNSTQIEFSIFHRVFLLLSETRATAESMKLQSTQNGKVADRHGNFN
jgi:hypothetical protein